MFGYNDGKINKLKYIFEKAEAVNKLINPNELATKNLQGLKLSH